MAKERTSKERKEELARKLQAKLQGERPHTTRRLLIASGILFLGLIGLWFASRPRPGLPPLLLVCLDRVAVAGEPVRVEARLEAPGEPEADLRGQKVEWRIPGRPDVAPVKVGADGRAEAEVPMEMAETELQVQATYIEPMQRYRRDDLGRVFVWDRAASIRVVPLEELAPGLGPSELPEPKADVLDQVRAAAKGRRVVYTVRSADPVRYRQLRAWLKDRVGRDLDGPLLLAGPDDAAAELGGRFQGPVETWKSPDR